MPSWKYPIILKHKMVSRFLENPENHIGEFSKENGIPESCLRNWIRESEFGILGDMKKKKHFRYWTLKEKFDAILEYEKLSNDEKGMWLRKHDLKLERLEMWKKELISQLQSIENIDKDPTENKKIKLLEKELDRKDKALAEASALLFAKKKLDSMFGEKDEEK